MVVEAAAFFVVAEPLAGGFVEVFADVGVAVHVLGFGVGVEGAQVVVFGDEGLGIIIEDICEGGEGLGGGEGPDGAVPFAAVAGAVGAETGGAAPAGSRAARGQA